MPAVVVDTNVFIKALFNRDQPARWVLHKISSGCVTLLVSDEIEDELLTTVMAHAIDSGVGTEKARPAFRKVLNLVRKARRIKPSRVFGACPDPGDNKFFDCAVQAKADCIVAMDAHLSGTVESPVPVYSPWQFRVHYESDLRRR